MRGNLDDDFDNGVYIDPDPFLDQEFKAEFDVLLDTDYSDEYDEDDEYSELEF